MSNPFLDDALAMGDELIAVRRDLHMHPELGFQSEAAVRCLRGEAD